MSCISYGLADRNHTLWLSKTDGGMLASACGNSLTFQLLWTDYHQSKVQKICFCKCFHLSVLSIVCNQFAYEQQIFVFSLE